MMWHRKKFAKHNFLLQKVHLLVACTLQIKWAQGSGWCKLCVCPSSILLRKSWQAPQKLQYISHLESLSPDILNQDFSQDLTARLLTEYLTDVQIYHKNTSSAEWVTSQAFPFKFFLIFLIWQLTMLQKVGLESSMSIVCMSIMYTSCSLEPCKNRTHFDILSATQRILLGWNIFLHKEKKRHILSDTYTHLTPSWVHSLQLIDFHV